MVAGEICEHPPEQGADVELPEAAALPVRSKALLAA
jgi:hypothetical protein